MIGIIHYGVANLGSMRNMLRRMGVENDLVGTPEALLKVDKLILPGIGAYDHGVEQLADRGLIDALRRRVVEDRVPILGVCLGMQLLGLQSAEGVRQGLGLIDARCERFQPDSAARLRVPHMGWNHLESVPQSPILNGIDASARFYFVHSYHVVCSNPGDVLATANYGIRFTAMIQRGHIYGAQFHPEKSHRFGMRILQNFAGL